MKVGDVVDELLVHVSDPQSAVNMGAIHALNALWEHHCPSRINSFEEFVAGTGAPLPASLQVPGEAIGLVRASLVAALEAIDRARARQPSGPRGIVRDKEERDDG